MKKRRLFFVFLLSCMVLGGCSAQNDSVSVPDTLEYPSFLGSVQKHDDVEIMFRHDIVSDLLSGNKDLNRWADELERTVPKTPGDVWITFNVCLRAGRDETACRMLPLFVEMVATYPPKAGYRGSFCDQLRSRSRRCLQSHPAVLKAFYEAFDVFYCDPLFESEIEVMRKHLGGDAPLADWLRQRFDNALAHQSEGEARSPFDPPGLFRRVARSWQRLYINQLQHMGTVNDEWNRLDNEARSDPDDMLKTEILFGAISNVNDKKLQAMIPDLSWLAPTAEKRTAYDAWIIAQAVYNVSRDPKYFQIAETFLRRARETPLTPAQCEEYRRELASMNSMIQPERSDELIQQLFFVCVSDKLNQTLLTLNRAEEAQQIMLQTRDFRKEHGLVDNITLAGMTQAASGIRVVEKEIKEREPAGENDPVYWMERSHYYRGRQETEEQEAALRRGLALFDTPESRARARGWSYISFYRDLFQLLVQKKRSSDAMSLFEEHYALSEGEPENRSSIYSYSVNGLLDMECKAVVFPKLYKDLKDAVEWLKKTTRDSPELRNEKYVRFDSLAFQLMRQSEPNQRVFHIDNRDPLYWDILCRATEDYPLENLSRRLLFPKELDPKALKTAKTLLADPAITVQALYYLGKTLNEKDRPKDAMPFLRAALDSSEKTSAVWRIEDQLFQVATKTGDWALVERMVCDRASESLLYQAAQAAKKAGNRAATKRFERLLANLGIAE